MTEPRRGPREDPPRTRRDGLPRRVGEVLGPALDRLATSDQARAYSAWARAVGDQVAASTRAKGFGRGRLTVECDSSVWANELTYLGPQILRRMDEILPGHPVKQFRFVVHARPAGATGQESDTPPASEERRGEAPAPAAYGAARAEAEAVHDERLRAAIEAALRRSSEEPPPAPGLPAPDG